MIFDYGGRLVPGRETAAGFYEAAERRFVPRDNQAEKAATGLLEELGLRYDVELPIPRAGLGDRSRQAAARRAHAGGGRLAH